MMQLRTTNLLNALVEESNPCLEEKCYQWLSSNAINVIIVCHIP